MTCYSNETYSSKVLRALLTDMRAEDAELVPNGTGWIAERGCTVWLRGRPGLRLDPTPATLSPLAAPDGWYYSEYASGPASRYAAYDNAFPTAHYWRIMSGSRVRLRPSR